MIGQTIKTSRKRAGLSQGELGRLVGVDENTISRWELGATMPRRAYWPKIKEAIGVQIGATSEEADQ